MHEDLAAVCESLNSLSTHVLNSWSDDRKLSEVYGWHHPPMTRKDIAAIPADLANKLRLADIDHIDDHLKSRLQGVSLKIDALRDGLVPYIFNGNAHQALPAFITSIDWVSGMLEPILGWQKLGDNKAMPVQLVRRLRGIQADIDELAPNKDRLQEQIQLIKDATDAAESLPADMQSLKEARDNINRISSDSAEVFGKLDDRFSSAITILRVIENYQREAAKLVQQCEEAYRITTTKGLAAAFDQRASRLGWSMWLWVLGLLCSLVIGAYLGSNRIEMLTTAIAGIDPHWGVIWMNIALSALSVGAPLWFAWISTKQIGQRFKLAEDYAFKASVAKAYEGYKREAARIDEAFEARLFASALTRLEEAPLRLVGGIEHGSPWHELVSSAAFEKAIATVPELKEKFVEIAKAGLSQVGRMGKGKSIPPNSGEV